MKKIAAYPIQTATVLLLRVAAIAGMAMVLAHWTWIWFAPRAGDVAPPASEGHVATDSAYLLFGQPPVASAPAATGMAIRLLGIVAATAGQDGYAVVQLDTKKILAVRKGQELAPGIRLLEVGADHLLLERGGVRETLSLPVSDVNRKGINIVESGIL
ncbi:MAG TPA: type II secretion system protein N [Pseudomonadales bacterium]|nr:type II secretion system protein N [Pseudomonadales bacterium]